MSLASQRQSLNSRTQIVLLNPPALYLPGYCGRNLLRLLEISVQHFSVLQWFTSSINIVSATLACSSGLTYHKTRFQASFWPGKWFIFKGKEGYRLKHYSFSFPLSLPLLLAHGAESVYRWLMPGKQKRLVWLLCGFCSICLPPDFMFSFTLMTVQQPTTQLCPHDLQD